MSRRLIVIGSEYTIDDENAGLIELAEVTPNPESPIEVQGEPWGWTKPGPRPRGWPGPDANRDNPGPYDGEWEPRR